MTSQNDRSADHSGTDAGAARDAGETGGADTGRQQPRGRLARTVRSGLRQAPTLLVLIAIGGVAAWGHETGWKVPKFADLSGRSAAAADGPKEDWCAEHNVPDSRCIKCHPELIGASMEDWCPEHGTKESTCTLCHPELLTTGVAGDWCPEHAIPESSCTLCHPEIAAKGEAPPSETGITVSQDPAATQPAAATAPAAGATSHGGKGGAAATKPTKSQKDPKTCQTHTLKVQFASAQSVRKAGVRLGGVVERPMVAFLSATGEIDYDRTRFAQVATPLAGRIWRVEKEVGQPLKQGEVLALVDAAEVGRAKAEFLSAMATAELRRKTLKRLTGLSEQGMLKSQGELQEAEAAVKEANIRVFNAQQALINMGLSARPEDMADLPERRNVQFMGLPKSLAESLDPSSTPANLLPLVAPFDGVVVSRTAVAGEVVSPERERPLFEVADTRRMWVTLDLPLADAQRVKLGQDVTFRPDGSPDTPAAGKITWVSTAVDEQTRTVRVRADVENPDGRLLAHTFGAAQVRIREAEKAIAVPTEAIQWEGCCHVVFVRLAEDIFQTRKVKLGARANGYTEVMIGLLPGEVVVTAGSHVLKSEVLKSALGAGCCVEE